jgi:hypothetical protein
MSVIAKVVIINGEEQVLFEEVENTEVEFRLYYDNDGKVLFYTCEKPEGNYIVIDSQTYAEMRHDIKIVNGQITKLVPGIIISKLKPNSHEGTICAEEDVSIVVTEEFKDKRKWKFHEYELK